jgi:Ca-activated chloride channel homolog
MTLLDPVMLLWGLLAIPLALAAWMRRGKRQLVSSDLLWNAVAKERSWLKRQRPAIDVVVRIAILELLALAAADPHWNVDLRPRVLILDTSASMQARDGESTRFEKARSALGRTIDSKPAGEPMALLTEGSVTRVECGLTADRRRLQAALDAVSPTDASLVAPQALAVARALIGGDAPRRVIIATDRPGRAQLQAAGGLDEGPADPEWLVCGANAENVGITRFEVRSQLDAADNLDVLIELFNAGDAAVSCPLEIMFRGTKVHRLDLELAAGETFYKIEAVRAAEGGLLIARLLHADALDVDNAAAVQVPTPKRSRVLLVGGDSPALAAALGSLPNVDMHMATELVADQPSPDLTVWNGQAPAIFPPGGHFVVAPTSDCDLWTVTQATLGSAIVTDEVRSPLVEQVDFTRAVLEDPIGLRFQIPAQVLVRSTAGDPIYTLLERAAGDVLVLQLRLEKTDLAARPALPLLLANVLRHFGLGSESYRAATTTADMLSIAPAGGRRLLSSPVNTYSDVRPQQGVVGPLDRAGLWQLWPVVARNPSHAPVLEPHVIASQLASRAETDLNAPSGAVASLAESQPAPSAQSLAALLRMHPSSYLLVAAVLLLASEWWLRTGTVAGRTAATLLVLLALAAPTFPYSTTQRCVALAIDRSASVRGTAQDRADAFVEQTRAAGGPGQVLLVPFGAQPAAPATSPSTRSRSTDFGGSNPARALLTAAARIPPGLVPQIVLLSDGAQTEGDLLRASAGAGMPISVVPLAQLAGPEVCASELNAPPEAAPRDRFEVDVVIESHQADAGLVSLYSDDRPVEERRVELAAGRNVVPFRALMPQESPALLRAVLREFRDTTQENNQRSAIVYPTERPKVLVVSAEPPAGSRFAAALAPAGFDVTSIRPDGLEARLVSPADFRLLVLLNISAKELPAAAPQQIDAYVRSGGGLLVVGGAATFASAHYHDTRLEQMLPVEAISDSQPPAASLALVLLIDKSGSMREQQKLELAKRAAQQVVGKLAPQDQLGVIAFSSDSQWVTPLESNASRAQIDERIEALAAQGGTDMYPALEKAALALAEATAEHKQLILLTDGISVPGDFRALSRKLARQRICVSTVSVGDEADQSQLKQIAAITGGRYYHCADPADMPRMLVEETVAAVAATTSHARPLVLHQLPDLDSTDTPPPADAAATSAKPAAEVLLLTATGDPLLSWWRLGTGVAIAYTARADSAAESAHAGSAEGLFWARIARLAIGPQKAGDWDIHLARRGRQARLWADAVQSDAAFVESVEAALAVRGPGGARQPKVQWVAPGRLAADFDVPSLGKDELELRLRSATGAAQVERRAMVRDYSDEFRLSTADEALLRSVALGTGGIYDPQPEDAFQADGRSARRDLALAPYLIVGAIVWLLLDTLYRRFYVGRRFVA